MKNAVILFVFNLLAICTLQAQTQTAKPNNEGGYSFINRQGQLPGFSRFFSGSP
jgi:hypothetical protein